MTIVRRAEPTDLADLLAIDPNGSTSKRRDEIWAAIEAGSCWLADADGQTGGYMVIDTAFFGFPFVWLLVVSEPLRRRGIGTALLQFAEGLYPGTKLFTSTNQSNIPAQRLMEGVGFRGCGVVDHLDEGDPELFYVKLPEANTEPVSEPQFSR